MKFYREWRVKGNTGQNAVVNPYRGTEGGVDRSRLQKGWSYTYLQVVRWCPKNGRTCGRMAMKSSRLTSPPMPQRTFTTPRSGPICGTWPPATGCLPFWVDLPAGVSLDFVINDQDLDHYVLEVHNAGHCQTWINGSFRLSWMTVRWYSKCLACLIERWKWPNRMKNVPFWWSTLLTLRIILAMMLRWCRQYGNGKRFGSLPVDTNWIWWSLIKAEQATHAESQRHWWHPFMLSTSWTVYLEGDMNLYSRIFLIVFVRLPPGLNGPQVWSKSSSWLSEVFWKK